MNNMAVRNNAIISIIISIIINIIAIIKDIKNSVICACHKFVEIKPKSFA